MLRPICDDVWAFEDDLRLPGGLRLPSRTTILRRPDGGLVVHSPLALDDATAKEIDALGEVRCLVAPSCIHFLFLKDAIARYPQARVLGAPGLEKKIPGVAFEPLPARGRVEALGEGVRVRLVEGVPGIGEHVFLHEPSRSLIVTDLVFNVHRARFGMKVFLWTVGAWKRTAQSRVWRFVTKDRAAAAASVNEILGWGFDRAIVAHGDVVEDAAAVRLKEALRWTTRGAPPLLEAGTKVA